MDLRFNDRVRDQAFRVRHGSNDDLAMSNHLNIRFRNRRYIESFNSKHPVLEICSTSKLCSQADLKLKSTNRLEFNLIDHQFQRFRWIDRLDFVFVPCSVVYCPFAFGDANVEPTLMNTKSIEDLSRFPPMPQIFILIGDRRQHHRANGL